MSSLVVVFRVAVVVVAHDLLRCGSHYSNDTPPFFSLFLLRVDVFFLHLRHVHVDAMLTF